MALNDDSIIRLPNSDISGNLFNVGIDGKTSYSGVDIKALLHIYDGGKLAQERQTELSQSINDLNTKLQAVKSQQSTLNGQVGNNFTSDQVNQLNAVNRQTVNLQNTINALSDEHTRINNTKPEYSTKVLAELQTISISTHREKFPVRGLGSTYPRSFTRGPRTIAGSMIFTVFDRNVLDEFLESHPSDFDAHNPTASALIDQIPPFDITLSFANELGQVSYMTIYAIEFVNEGQTMSIEDLLLENVTNYVARDYDPMRALPGKKVDENNRMTNDTTGAKASDLLNQADYNDYKQNLSPFDRFKNRVNPFI